MAMVQRRNGRNGAIAAYAPLLSALSGNVGTALINGLSAQMRNLGTRASNGPQPRSTIRERGRAAQPKQRRKRVDAGRGTNGANRGYAGAVPRYSLPSLAGSNTTVATFRDVVAINNAAGTQSAAVAFAMGVSTVSGLMTLAQIVPRFSTVSTLYRQFTILKIRISSVPVSADTTGGALAVAVDPDELAGVPSSYGSVLRHRSSFFSDIKAPASLTWTAKQDMKLPKFSAGFSGRDEDQWSQGVIQVYSLNSNVPAANITNLLIELDVMFIGPT